MLLEKAVKDVESWEAFPAMYGDWLDDHRKEMQGAVAEWTQVIKNSPLSPTQANIWCAGTRGVAITDGGRTTSGIH